MKNWELSIEDGMTGGRFKRFFTFGSALKYAKKHFEENSWIYIDNKKYPEINRIYIKQPINNN